MNEVMRLYVTKAKNLLTRGFSVSQDMYPTTRSSKILRTPH
jgi:hypothetical protein